MASDTRQCTLPGLVLEVDMVILVDYWEHQALDEMEDPFVSRK